MELINKFRIVFVCLALQLMFLFSFQLSCRDFFLAVNHFGNFTQTIKRHLICSAFVKNTPQRFLK